MSVINKDLFALVEEWAPKHFVEDWDNTGLQVGSSTAKVKRVLLTLDVDEKVAAEAREHKAELIISHHPMIMKKGIKNINTDVLPGRLIAQLIRDGITVYAAHTNLDSTWGGVNDVLAEKVGLQNIEVLNVSNKQKYYKLVVFVPVDHQQAVRQALSEAGAGWIGNYSDCTFRTTGTGTFRPREGSNPFIGSKGQIEEVEEVRLETIVPAEKLSTVVQAMQQAHPYEEVAYDIYKLSNDGPVCGLGRVGNLLAEMEFEDFIKQVKQSLNIEVAKVGGNLKNKVKRVAVCGGGAAALWPVALAKGADVYISSDIKYHVAQDMLNNGLAFIDAGHYHSEVPVVEKLYHYLKKHCQGKNIDVDLIISKTCVDPFVYL